MGSSAPAISTPADTRRQAAIVAVLVALLAGAFALDGWSGVHLRLDPDAPVRGLANSISRWMDWPWVLGALLLATLAAHGRGAVAARQTLLSLLLAGAVVGGSATRIRSTTGRTRPSAPVAQGWYGPRVNGKWLIGRRDYNAFPSGHTATVAGIAALLILRRHRFAPLMVGATLLVGWSRIAVGAHRPSDVAASLLLAGILIRPLARRLPAPKAVPTAAPSYDPLPATAANPEGGIAWSA